MGAAVDESGSCAGLKGCLSAGKNRLVSGRTPSDDNHGNEPGMEDVRTAHRGATPNSSSASSNWKAGHSQNGPACISRGRNTAKRVW